MLLFCESRWSQ